LAYRVKATVQGKKELDHFDHLEIVKKSRIDKRVAI